MGFYTYIGSQFANPRGAIGKICCGVMNLMNRAMYNETAAALCADSPFRLLDIGFGNGHLIRKLDRKTKGEFYGIDISADAMKNAARKNRAAIACGRVHLSLGDCCRMNYNNQFFDAVTTVNTVYFWENTENGFSEILRVLKAGGVFINVFYSPAFLKRLRYTRVGFRFFSPEEIKSLAIKAGFQRVKIKSISHRTGYLVICTK